MHRHKIHEKGLTFDDVLILPGYTDFTRDEIDLSTQLTKHITLQLPLVSSPMDTVTDARLATALARVGGIGIIHRNMSIAQQAQQVADVKKENLLVAAAIGASKGYEERVQALIKADVDIVLIDTAHGYTKNMIDIIKAIKNTSPNLEIIAGSVATYDAALALIQAGADALRVGMGPGAICTTRIISGMGVPQISAIMGTVKAAQKFDIPVIADGGIKQSGDIVKALAAGASSVMMGSYFASCEEAPGKVVELRSNQVPLRFKSIFKEPDQTYKFKAYRGMGSVGAMKEGARIKSEDEFHGKSYKDRVLVAEGVDGYVPVKGPLVDSVDQTVGGIRSGMYYIGARTIPELAEKAEFIQITQASLVESHPHDILVTDAGQSYAY